MDLFIATLKDKKIVVSLDNKMVFERYRNNIQAIARFTARKDELKRFGYHIQRVAVDTIAGSQGIGQFIPRVKTQGFLV